MLTRAGADIHDPEANVVAYAAGALQAIGMKEAELAAPRKRVLDAPEASVSARFLVARNLVGYEAPGKLVGPMIEYLEHNARFRAPVRAGDTLTTRWTVTARDDKPKHAGGVVSLAGVCRNQNNVVVADASGRILVHNRPATT